MSEVKFDIAATAVAKHEKIPFRLIAVFLLLTIGIGTAGYFYYENQKSRIINDKQDELSAIANLKINQITTWRHERIKDVIIISENPMILNSVSRFMQNENIYEYRTETFKLLSDLIKYYDYERATLFNTNGRLMLWAGEKSEEVETHARMYVADALKNGKIDFIDLHKDEPSGSIQFGLSVPLFSQETKDRHLIGVLILRIDPFKFLYPLIQTWPTPSLTGETLLVRREGNEAVFINELRHQKNTAFTQHFTFSRKEIPAVMAVLGKKGIVEGIDYRGVPVIASVGQIPGSPWFIVAKMDKEEIYAPRARQAQFVLFVVVALIIAAGAGIGMWWRQERSAYYKKQYGMAEALRILSSRHEAILAAVPDIIMEVDANKVYIWANQPGMEFFGGDVVGKEAAFYFEGKQATYDVVQPLFYGKEDVIYVESWQRRKDGQKRLLAWWCRVLKDESGHVIGALSSARDITEHVLAQKLLLENEHRLKKSQEIAHLGSWEIDVVNNNLTWSDEVYRIFGLQPQEFSATYEAFLEAIHPDDRAAVDEAYSGSLRKGIDTYEIEHRVVQKSTGEIRYVYEKCEHVRDETGRIIRSVGMVHDITERKKAEDALNRYMAELKRSNEELQQFAYIASHDLQEPLRMITSYLQLIERRYKGKLDKNADEFIAFATDGAMRLQEMIIGLLAYSRVQTKGRSFEKVSASEVLGNAISNLKIVINESSALVTADQLPVVKADAIQLLEIFQNLISNSIKFRGKEPPIIHVSAERKKEEWLFSVKDNGVGIAPEYKDRIFNIFQRLHSRDYPGVGIGLSLCRRIVERHGGRIWFESEVGKGTTFYFTIPVKEKT